MRSTFRVTIDRGFRDRATAQRLADAINASASLRGVRAVVVEQGPIGRSRQDLVDVVESIIGTASKVGIGRIIFDERHMSSPPPLPVPRTCSKDECERIVGQYGERDGRMFARRASKAEVAQCVTLNSVSREWIDVFFHRRKSRWKSDGHVLYPYGFQKKWYDAGFIDGVVAELRDC